MGSTFSKISFFFKKKNIYTDNFTNNFCKTIHYSPLIAKNNIIINETMSFVPQSVWCRSNRPRTGCTTITTNSSNNSSTTSTSTGSLRSCPGMRTSITCTITTTTTTVTGTAARLFGGPAARTARRPSTQARAGRRTVAVAACVTASAAAESVAAAVVSAAVSAAAVVAVARAAVPGSCP